MSEPANTRKGRGGSRIYLWPAEPPHELEVPSVTTILGGGFPKPALQRWASKEAATWAVDNQSWWINMPPDAAIQKISGAPWAKRDDKAKVGTTAHEAIEAVLTGSDRDEVLDTVPPGELGYTYAGFSFIDVFRPVIRAVETTVYSRKHQYGGTMDLLADIHGEIAVIDFKTSKDIYKDYGLQLAAYANADFRVGLDGRTELPMEKVDLGISVCLRPDGTLRAIPFRDLGSLFEVFLHVQEVFSWQRSYKLGEALTP